jgi:acid stress-induced BolA-like protein IbaG/YrbA
MTTPESIHSAIVQGLSCERVEVGGDGQHFEALIVSAAFEGRSRIERHRLVYSALGDRMRQEIHALSMRTMTPAEWAATVPDGGAHAPGAGTARS